MKEIIKFILVLMVLSFLSCDQNEKVKEEEPKSLTRNLTFDALDKNAENIMVDMTYSFSVGEKINEECPYETIIDVEDGLVRPEIRATIRHKLGKLEKEEIEKSDFKALVNEINQIINMDFTYNGKKAKCNIKLDTITINEIKYN